MVIDDEHGSPHLLIVADHGLRCTVATTERRLLPSTFRPDSRGPSLDAISRGGTMSRFNRLTLGKRRLCWLASVATAAATIAAIEVVLAPAAPAAYPGPNGLIAFSAVVG